MEGYYTKLVMLATFALFLHTANAVEYDPTTCSNLDKTTRKACEDSRDNPLSTQCCDGLKVVDNNCICFLITIRSTAEQREYIKKKIENCGIDVSTCATEIL